MKPTEREYSVSEIAVDGAVHAVGIVASLIAVPVLLVLQLPRVDLASGFGLSVYGLALLLMFVASAAYNLIPAKSCKPILRRFDQAAIFFKIAGTYTPLVAILGGVFAWILLAAVWLAAIFGAVAKLAFVQRFEKFTIPTYLLMGWAGLLIALPLAREVPPASVVLLVVGGVLYSAGVAFHRWETLKYQNAIWHAFVLAATTCHFIAITGSSFAAAVS
jgi:hemolysin III